MESKDNRLLMFLAMWAALMSGLILYAANCIESNQAAELRMLTSALNGPQSHGTTVVRYYMGLLEPDGRTAVKGFDPKAENNLRKW